MMKITWKKTLLSVVAIGAAAITLAGCSSNSSSNNDAEKNIQWNLPSELTTLDSGLATDTHAGLIIGNVMSGLTRVDENGDAANELAEDIQVSDDGLTYTITLKEELKWSNGDDLTAKDFVYGWQRNVIPETKAQYASLVEPVKNAAAITSGDMEKEELGVEATSDTTLVVTLEQPTPYFEYLLTMSVYFPLNQEVVEEHGDQYGTASDKMVYSGPYMFTTSNGWNGSNQTFSIYKNPEYYDATVVEMEQIDFQVVPEQPTALRLYKQGKLDQAFISAANLYKENKDDENVINLEEATTAYLEFNQSGEGATSPDAQKALANQKIRQAFAFATDREGFLASVAPASAPATGLTPSGMARTPSGEDFADYAKQPYTYDPERAAELFQEGLEEVGLSSLTLSYLTDDTEVARASGTYLQQNYQNDLPGLTLEVRNVPFKQRLDDSDNGNFDIVMSLWGGDYAEPSTFLDLFVTGGPYNNGSFSNSAYDAAIKASKDNALDPEKAAENFMEAEQALYEQANINPVYFRTVPALRNPNVSGIIFGSTGLTYDFKYATKTAN